MISMRNKAKDLELDDEYGPGMDGRSPSQASGDGDGPDDREPPEVGNLFEVALLVAVVACVVDMVALALPWWSYSTAVAFGTEIKTNAGLWSVCKKITPVVGEVTENCAHIGEPQAYVENTRSCNTVGLLFMGLGVITVMIYRYWQTHLHLLLLIGGMLFNIAGLLTWVVAIMFSARYSEERGNSASELHASCYLSLLAGVTYHVVCVLAVFKVDRSRTSVEPKTGN